MSETNNPFAQPFRPSEGSPLAQTQREHSPFVTVTNVEEQRRAESITADMQSGALTPIFDPVQTQPPFPAVTPVARPRR
jgi:hypothetical protein